MTNNIKVIQKGVRKPLPRPIKYCLNCGNVIKYVFPCNFKRRKFCSRECFISYERTHSRLSVRTLAIIKMRENNPCATLEQIRKANGNISRERVRQILKRANKTTRHYYEMTLYRCLNCGRETKNKSGFCCIKCKIDYNCIPLVCDNCGTLFTRKKNIVIYSDENRGYKGHQFCSRKCVALYFKIHPPHIKGGDRIYDYDLIEKLYLENKSHKEIQLITKANSVLAISNIIFYLRKTKNIDRPHFNACSNRDIGKGE